MNACESLMMKGIGRAWALRAGAVLVGLIVCMMPLKLFGRTSAAAQERSKLQSIATELDVYYEKHSSYPEARDQQGRTWVYKLLWNSADPTCPYAYLSSWELRSRLDPSLDSKPIDVTLLDEWGSEVHYELVDGRVVLYSLGPNQQDDRGRVDDIVPGRDEGGGAHDMGWWLQVVLCLVFAATLWWLLAKGCRCS